MFYQFLFLHIRILYRNFTLNRGNCDWVVIDFSSQRNKRFILWKLFFRAGFFWILKNIVFKFSIQITAFFLGFCFTKSSRSQMFFKTGLLKNIAISTVKYLCGSLFITVWKAWRTATLSKRDFKTDVFLWN